MVLGVGERVERKLSGSCNVRTHTGNLRMHLAIHGNNWGLAVVGKICVNVQDRDFYKKILKAI